MAMRAGARLGAPDSVVGEGAPAGRLAASQQRRRRRIVDAAVRLAEKGGFEAVRLRDVAEASDVALGTLYKYFRSKEDILLYALTEAVEGLEASLAAQPPQGRSPLARVTSFFQRAMAFLTRKPRFARALLRSLASGDAETAHKVAAFHLRMTRLIVAALRGEATRSERQAHRGGRQQIRARRRVHAAERVVRVARGLGGESSSRTRRRRARAYRRRAHAGSGDGGLTWPHGTHRCRASRPPTSSSIRTGARSARSWEASSPR